MKRKIFIALWTILIFVPGCSHRVYVTSNSYADTHIIPYGFPIGASFRITPKKNTTMLSKEIARKIEHILINNDYTVVHEGPADYDLSFSYGMESSVHTREALTYVPGTTHITHGYAMSVTGSGALYQEQTTTPGAFVTVPEQYTLYERKPTVHVHTTNHFTKNKKKEEVWQASAISTGESGNLRETMDYLLSSAFKHFGENTGGRILEEHTA